MRQKKLQTIYILSLFYSFLLPIACNNLEVDLAEIKYDNPLRIGLIVPLSAERTGEGTAYFATILAAEEINAAGGILGRDIEIVFMDDAGIPAKGVENVKKMKNDGIDIVLGSAWSSVTLAAAREFTISNGMLLISHSATSPQISNLDDNNLVWRTSPSDVFQGRIGADFVFNVFGKKSIGIIHSKNVFAEDLAKAFRNSFEAVAGANSTLSFVSYPEVQDWSAFDFTTQLNELFADKPEAVYISGFAPDAVKITNDIFKGNYLSNGYRPQFFSNDGPFGDDFLFNGNPDVLEGMAGTQPSGALNDPNYISFIKNFNDRFGFDPVAFNEHMYDAVYLIAYAILKSGSTSPLNIANQLRNVSGGNPAVQGTIINIDEFTKAKNILDNGGEINYNGASGLIDFDENGDPTSGTYNIWKIINGKYVIEATIIFP